MYASISNKSEENNFKTDLGFYYVVSINLKKRNT
jgi:hypothetical protein